MSHRCPALARARETSSKLWLIRWQTTKLSSTTALSGRSFARAPCLSDILRTVFSRPGDVPAVPESGVPESVAIDLGLTPQRRVCIDANQIGGLRWGMAV